MAQTCMLGVGINVDDLESAGDVLSQLGMTAVPVEEKGQSLWLGGRHFLLLRASSGRSVGDPDRVVYFSGDAGDFSIDGIAFRRWLSSAPTAVRPEPGAITGIDHVITMVPSIEQAGERLRQHGISRAEPVREFPAISTLARMYLLDDGYIELNEPLGSGTPAWGAASGIVGLVLQTNGIEEFRNRFPSAPVSRTSSVRARRPGHEPEELGLVSLVKTRAFGEFQMFVYEPKIR